VIGERIWRKKLEPVRGHEGIATRKYNVLGRKQNREEGRRMECATVQKGGRKRGVFKLVWVQRMKKKLTDERVVPDRRTKGFVGTKLQKKTSQKGQGQKKKRGGR